MKVTRISTTETVVTHLSLFGGYIAYGANHSRARGILPDHVTVRRLRDGRTWTFPSSFGPNGITDWVEGAGNLVVWTDEQTEPSDTAPSVTWRLFAARLPRGRPMLIDSSGRSGREFIPLPRAGGSTIVWPVAAPPAFAIKTYQGQQVRTVLTGVDPSDIGVSGSAIIFDRTHAGQRRDVFVYDLGTGRTSQLSTSGLVFRPRAGDGEAVWQQPPGGDPDSIWARPVTAEAPPTRVAGAGTAGNAVPGACFVAYLTDTGAAVSDIFGRWHEPITANASVLARLAAHGNAVVWANDPALTGQPPGPTVINMVVLG